MTPASQQFSWKNRDVAARDLLQLVYFAPNSIRKRALQLLPAFRSAGIFPELEQIVMDEARHIWERRYALRAITSIRDDLYVPQFARFSSLFTSSDEDKLSMDDLFLLVRQHPRNTEWVFLEIETHSPKTYAELLVESAFYAKRLNPILCRKLMEVLERHPLLLNIEIVHTLYTKDGSENTLNWLQARWDELIYLCLVGNTGQVFRLLSDWEALREAVFKNCPAIIAEYEQKKESEAAYLQQRKIDQNRYQDSDIWKELYEWYQSALDKDHYGYLNLVQVVRYESRHPARCAAATHLLGKLKHLYNVRPALFHVLRYMPGDNTRLSKEINIYACFEAGEALCDLALPDVWETMVDAFFVRPEHFLVDYMVEWIEHLTDRLSGIDTPYTGEKNSMWRRRWFRDLAEAEVQT